jgi:hypothetical protein
MSNLEKKQQTLRSLPLPVIILIELLFIALVTHCTFDLFAFELKSAAYDSLGISFLRGSAEVSLRAIADEAHRVEGRTFMYFGFFPALVRMPLHFLFPSLIGYWGRISCLCAAMLAVYFFSRISRLVLESRQELIGLRTSQILHWTVCIGFACATPIIYLISCAYIYHEASLWGLAGSLLAIWGLIEVSLSTSVTRFAAYFRLSVGAGIALCSRGTFGVPYLLLLGIFGSYGLIQLVRSRRLQATSSENTTINLQVLIVILLPALFFLGIQLWYNYARYGNFFDVGITRASSGHSYLQKVIDLGPEVVFQRIKCALSNYFAMPWQYFDLIFPYIHLKKVSVPTLGIYANYQEWTISLFLLIPWLLVLSLIGLYQLVRYGNWRERLSITSFAAQWYVILTFYFITQRYAADFLPLLVLLATFSLRLIKRPLSSQSSLRLCGALIALVVFSITTNLLATIAWNLEQNWALSPQDRQLMEAVSGNSPARLPVPPEFRNEIHLKQVPL